MLKIIHIFAIAVTALLLVSIHSVLGDQETDSAYPAGNSNYANTGIGKILCSSYGGDVDGDGICDSWEVSSPDPSDNNFAGLRVSFTDPVNPGVVYKYKLACDTSKPGDCPSTSQKDVYVEVDWMKHHNPDQAAMDDVVNAFKNAQPPIALHLQYGEDPNNQNFAEKGNMTTHYNFEKIYNRNAPGTFVAYLLLKQTYFGTVAERQNTQSASCPSNATPSTIPASYSYNCLTAKRQAFHYATFVNKQYGAATSSGWSEIIGNDFLVSLGSFVANNGRGSIDEQEGAFMHELGHNFGLWHGGMAYSGNAEDDNCKPDYLSVMSYTYEFRENADVCRPLDYSRGSLSGLNEASLSDSSLGSYTYPSNNPPPPPNTMPGQPSTCPTSGERPIWYNTPSGIRQGITGTTTNDWNQNNPNSDSSPYTQNLNNLNIAGGCNTGSSTNLSGYNDWAHLYFSFQDSSNFNGGIVPEEPQANGTETKLGMPATLYDSLPKNDTVEGKGLVADVEMTAEQVNNSIQSLSTATHGNTCTTDCPQPFDWTVIIIIIIIVIAAAIIIVILATRRRR